MFERYFKLGEHGTNPRTEIIAGITTFVTMAYILFLNPSILKGTGMSENAVFFATALGAGLVTLMMGLFVNFPVGLAPGMGLNAYFAVVAAQGGTMTWQVALGAVFVSGIFFILLTISGFRQMLVKALPDSLKYAITVGIGLFITFIGLKLGEISGVTFIGGPSTEAIKAGAPAVNLLFFEWNIGIANFVANKAAALTVIGLLIAGVLTTLRIRGALLISIVLTTLIGIPMGVTQIDKLSTTSFLPNFSDLAVGKLDFSMLGSGLFWEVVIVMVFVELFDSFGTLVGTAQRAGLLNRPDGEKRLSRAMFVDGAGVSIGALLGVTPMTAYIESAAGIESGGRTGLTAVTTGIMFLLSIVVLAPFAAIIPDAATAPALIIVGVLMMSSVRHIAWEDFGIAMPAFLTITLMPFTYSIANGISIGVVAFVILNGARNAFGKDKTQKVEVHWLMWVIAVLAVARYVFLAGQ
ncbi:NCS2 family permease [Tumebacillus permanentifrigoris]|uniref:AGZA family xanthine/uracil permease-like MFS transporter n=1 Tax=Tumebacillus permanentifrigoris TaxID=378543 RepID=A0A316D5X8_9BACL|nr:NCS2 family permease [Tumebacillus permanentifrigoris]PWK09660.1 AGZA family xanthine/uracil permease-like MFS transporter [Tumebacillus permanentifrigoris]